MPWTKCALYASLVVTVLAGCAALQSEAEKPRVAVLEIQGAKSAELQETLLEILGEDYTIVYDDEYRDTAREIGARRMKRRHVKKVARRLGVEILAPALLELGVAEGVEFRDLLEDGCRHRPSPACSGS